MAIRRNAPATRFVAMVCQIDFHLYWKRVTVHLPGGNPIKVLKEELTLSAEWVSRIQHLVHNAPCHALGCCSNRAPRCALALCFRSKLRLANGGCRQLGMESRLNWYTAQWAICFIKTFVIESRQANTAGLRATVGQTQRRSWKTLSPVRV